MRKTAKLTLMCALPLLAGCAMEDALENDRETSEQEITIQAVREGGNGETRTALQSDGKTILWTPGDKISLFYGSGSGGGSRFTSTATENTKVTNFTGTIGVITGGAEVKQEDTYFWGLYPYQEDASCDGSTVTMTLPSAQTATPGTFAPGLFPSLGRSQGLNMGFYNICGLWWFSVTKEGVRKVTLKGNNGEIITGKAKIGFDRSGDPEVKEITEGSDEIVLECPRGEYFEVNKNYYIVMFPTEFASGFTMTFETYTEEGVYNRTRETTIARNGNRGITGLDSYLTTPYTQKTGNIPVEDANFKAYLTQNFDTNGDGEISYEEAANITSIARSTEEIESIQGIEYMINLTRLTAARFPGSLTYHRNSDGTITHYTSNSRGKLTSVDLSNNTKLRELSLGYNQLTSLDVSQNTELTDLDCSRNLLTALELSNNTELEDLTIDGNQLTNMDVTNNPGLITLSFDSNLLTDIDVSNNKKLKNIWCWDNRLTNIDVSMCNELTTLLCSDNQLTTIDVSKNAALANLSCFYNQLTTLDVSKNTALTSLYCYSNQLTTLDVSNNTALTVLNCSSNKLTTLDVSKNTALTNLDCGYNLLTTLDVTKSANLKTLKCMGKDIIDLYSLDLSKNLELEELYCGTDNMSNLDLSNNIKLKKLRCTGHTSDANGSTGSLNSLDVSKNTELTYLDCAFNHLTYLDVSNNTKLTELWCDYNQLTTLDVSKNTELKNLHCTPMNDSNGNNLFTTLYIYQGQEIPYVTTNRSANYIPEATEIKVATPDGGDEDLDDPEEEKP